LTSLFGTWCPNCNYESVHLAGLAKRYGKRGSSIRGAALELTDDLERSVDMVGRYETLIQELLAE
jgi:thiol-disulfide isomerase/thioredoxin